MVDTLANYQHKLHGPNESEKYCMDLVPVDCFNQKLVGDVDIHRCFLPWKAKEKQKHSVPSYLISLQTIVLCCDFISTGDNCHQATCSVPCQASQVTEWRPKLQGKGWGCHPLHYTRAQLSDWKHPKSSTDKVSSSGDGC